MYRTSTLENQEESREVKNTDCNQYKKKIITQAATQVITKETKSKMKSLQAIQEEVVIIKLYHFLLEKSMK